MASLQEIRDSIGNALSQAVAPENEMVTRWVTVVEVMDSDGERSCYLMSPPGSKSWDVTGLLTFALHVEQAASCCDNDDDDGDD